MYFLEDIKYKIFLVKIYNLKKKNSKVVSVPV